MLIFWKPEGASFVCSSLLRSPDKFPGPVNMQNYLHAGLGVDLGSSCQLRYLANHMASLAGFQYLVRRDRAVCNHTAKIHE